VLRFATAYGLSPRPRFDLTVNEFTRELTLSRRLEVHGRQFWRPYAHACDLAAACVTVLGTETEKVAGQAFNIGGNDENYQKESLVAMIIRELDTGGDDVVYVQRDEDPRDYRVNFDKARRRLGFELSRSVSDGIREIIGAIRSGIIVDPDSEMFRNA
jgi:nucleoside-diphosphate-sugar epimerase